MSLSKTTALILLGASVASVNSFGINTAVSSLTLPTSRCQPTLTCLFAEEEAEAEAPTEESENASDSAPSAEMDILSSPAFLKRKIEVLKADLEGMDAEIEEAKERAEAGKAEWAPQLDDLRLEVRHRCKSKQLVLSQGISKLYRFLHSTKTSRNEWHPRARSETWKLPKKLLWK